MSLKIAFVVNNYPPRTGGLEQHVFSLARELVARGHQVVVLTLSEEPDFVSHENGITVYRLREIFQVDGVLGFPAFSSYRRLYSVLKNEKVNAISVHTRFFTMTWLGVLLGKILKIPVLHTEHGSGFVVSEKKFISLASKLVDYTLGRVSLRASSKVICVSEPSKDFVKKLSGVEGEIFYNVSPLEPQAAENIEINRKKLIFLARMVEVKGWRTFLEVVAQLSAHDPEVRGVLLGAGPDLEKAKKYAAELGVEDHVQFRGFVSHSEVGKELKGATLLNPTVAAEGFQTTIIDAFVSQAGIVTYDVSSARVLQERGVAVRIVHERTVESLAQAVQAEIDSEPTIYDPAQLREWSWSNQAEVYEELLYSLLAEPK